MLRPFYNEAQVRLSDGTDLRFVVNFLTVDAIEALLGLPMPEIIPQIAGAGASYSKLAKVVWGLLREHHPEVTLPEAMGLMFGDDADAVGVAVGDLLRRAFNLGEVKAKNPPKRRGASKTS